MSDHITGNVSRDALLGAFTLYVQARDIPLQDSQAIDRLLAEAGDATTTPHEALQGLRGELPVRHPFYSLDRAHLWLAACRVPAALIVTRHAARVAVAHVAGVEPALDSIPPALILRVIAALPEAHAPIAAVWQARGAAAKARKASPLPEGWTKRAPEPPTVSVYRYTTPPPAKAKGNRRR